MYDYNPQLNGLIYYIIYCLILRRSDSSDLKCFYFRRSGSKVFSFMSKAPYMYLPILFYFETLGFEWSKMLFILDGWL